MRRLPVSGEETTEPVTHVKGKGRRREKMGWRKRERRKKQKRGLFILTF